MYEDAYFAYEEMGNKVRFLLSFFFFLPLLETGSRDGSWNEVSE